MNRFIILLFSYAENSDETFYHNCFLYTVIVIE